MKENPHKQITFKKEISKKEHIASTEQTLCPKCGGVLSIKKGKYGEFYGCSNFPKCRFTKKVSNQVLSL